MNDTYIDVPSFLSDLLVHLADGGFLISADTETRYFMLASKTHPSTMKDTHDLLQLLICKTTSDIEAFDQCFYKFFYPLESKEEKRQQSRLQQASQQTRQYKERLRYAIEQQDDRAAAEQALEKLNAGKEELYNRSALDRILSKMRAEDIEMLKTLARESDEHNSEEPWGRQNAGKCFAQVLEDDLHNVSASHLNMFSTNVNPLLKECVRNHKSEYLKPINKIKKVFHDAEKSFEKYDAQQLILNERIKQIDRQLALIDQLTKKIQENELLIQKYSVQNHRPYFEGKSPVQLYEDFAEIGNTEIKLLSSKEKQEVYAYIRRNAQKFYTIMRRSMRTFHRKEIDLKETVHQACLTGGVPIKLAYKKRKPSKPNVVMLLDISGSCRSASEMMLVYMHYMKKVFKGGCKAFAFVGHVYDISETLSLPEADEAVKNVLNTIPTRGVYSNYALALEEMKNEYSGYFNKDTIMIYIGDARNNKNDSQKEIVHWISSKTKRSYWLNTESHIKWNMGDSIVHVYEPYMNKVEEVITPKQLIEFMLDI